MMPPNSSFVALIPQAATNMPYTNVGLVPESIYCRLTKGQPQQLTKLGMDYCLRASRLAIIGMAVSEKGGWKPGGSGWGRKEPGGFLA